MSHLYKFTVPHVDEFPGALFRIHDAIPITECEIATGVTTVEKIAAEAHAQGKAHTFANGHLYTDLTNVQMAAYCVEAYAPQT